MKRILCYGDSNTWGRNPDIQEAALRYEEEERWTGILQQELRCKVIEEGLSGRTVMCNDPISPERNGRKFLSCCIQSHQPLDLIIFMLGTNDVRCIFSAPVKEIAIGMRNLVNLARNPLNYEVGKTPDILVLSPPPIRTEIASSEFYGIYDETSVEKSKQLANAYNGIFKDMQGVLVMDAGEVTQAAASDSIHLNKEGHQKLGEAVATLIQERLLW